MYTSLSMDPYKYVLTTSMSPLETARALSYKCTFVPNKLYNLRRLDYASKTSHFINKCNSVYIAFFHFWLIISFSAFFHILWFGIFIILYDV